MSDQTNHRLKQSSDPLCLLSIALPHLFKTVHTQNRIPQSTQHNGTLWLRHFGQGKLAQRLITRTHQHPYQQSHTDRPPLSIPSIPLCICTISALSLHSIFLSPLISWAPGLALDPLFGMAVSNGANRSQHKRAGTRPSTPPAFAP